MINYRALVTSNNINNSTHKISNNNNDNIQVENEETSYHILEMQPSNIIFLSFASVLGCELDDLKLDITDFNQAYRDSI